MCEIEAKAFTAGLVCSVEPLWARRKFRVVASRGQPDANSRDENEAQDQGGWQFFIQVTHKGPGRHTGQCNITGAVPRPGASDTLSGYRSSRKFACGGAGLRPRGDFSGEQQGATEQAKQTA